jgi:diguanylate cyclase (GGDEF)-like protein
MSRAPLPAGETALLVSLSATSLFGMPEDYVFDCITNIGAQLFNAPVCTLALADAEKNRFNACVAMDIREAFRNTFFGGNVVADSEPRVIEDTLRDVRWLGDPLVHIAPQIRFFARHPIRGLGGAALGTLYILDFKPREFPPEQLRLLEEFVFLIELSFFARGITTVQKALGAKLDLARRESLVDPLLRIWNRGGIKAIIDEQHKSALEMRVPFSILMIDIDHFKNVNDHHGHIAGDTVLKAVTGVLLASLRKDDELGRYGGEEFIAILPNTDAINAEVLARRLNDSVSDLKVHMPAGLIGCTVSIGVAEWAPARPESVQALVHRADAALLSAKQCGRNRVCLSRRAA